MDNGNLETIKPANDPILETLGLSEKFHTKLIFANGPNKWHDTDPVQLIGGNNIICVELEAKPYTKQRKVTGLFLFNHSQQNPTPLGYVTYPYLNTPYAEMDYNPFIGSAVTESINMQQINPNIQQCLNRSNYLLGMAITNQTRRACGLGKMLFLLGAAYLQDKGYRQLRVKNDVTDKNIQGTSFYTHLGATEVLNTHHKDFDINDLVYRYSETIKSYFDL